MTAKHHSKLCLTTHNAYTLLHQTDSDTSLATGSHDFSANDTYSTGCIQMGIRTKVPGKIL